MSKPLPQSFYAQNTVDVAKLLVGKNLCVLNTQNQLLTGIISETEAYCGFDDDACHGSKGITERNQTLFKNGGISYVYFIYGMYYMLNVVTERESYPSAVLIREVIPKEGRDVMIENRYTESSDRISSNKIKNLANGPGKLTKAFGIDLSFNGIDLTKNNNMWIEENSVLDINKDIRALKRVGIDYAVKSKDNLWRFRISE